MKAIHFVCHLDGLKPRNSKELPPAGEGRYRLGWWALTAEEVGSLRNGFAYLHEKSTLPSYSENRIEGYMAGQGEVGWSNRSPTQA